MPDGGELRVATSLVELDPVAAVRIPDLSSGRYVLVTVSDTGVGMSRSVAARAFEPYFTTKPVGQGTGVGLALVFGAVSQAGGAVHCYSEAGNGTVMRVYLPVAAAELEPTSLAPAAVHSEAVGETLLVVEDDEVVRTLTSRILQRQGYQVLSAGSAEEALAIWSSASSSIAGVVSDVSLPGMSGPALLHELRAQRDIPAVFVSGNVRHNSDSTTTAGTTTLFVEKPFTRDELLVAVRDVLAAQH